MAYVRKTEPEFGTMRKKFIESKIESTKLYYLEYLSELDSNNDYKNIYNKLKGSYKLAMSKLELPLNEEEKCFDNYVDLFLLNYEDNMYKNSVNNIDAQNVYSEFLKYEKDHEKWKGITPVDSMLESFCAHYNYNNFNSDGLYRFLTPSVLADYVLQQRKKDKTVDYTSIEKSCLYKRLKSFSPIDIKYPTLNSEVTVVEAERYKKVNPLLDYVLARATRDLAEKIKNIKAVERKKLRQEAIDYKDKDEMYNALFIMSDFSKTSDSKEKFCRRIGISNSEFDKNLDVLKNYNHELYDEVFSIVNKVISEDTKEKIYDLIKIVYKKIAKSKSSDPKDKNDFGLLEYYSLTNMPFETLLEFAYAERLEAALPMLKAFKSNNTFGFKSIDYGEKETMFHQIGRTVVGAEHINIVKNHIIEHDYPEIEGIYSKVLKEVVEGDVSLITKDNVLNKMGLKEEDKIVFAEKTFRNRPKQKMLFI